MTWDALETYLSIKPESCTNTWQGTDLHLALIICFSISIASRSVTMQAIKRLPSLCGTSMSSWG